MVWPRADVRMATCQRRLCRGLGRRRRGLGRRRRLRHRRRHRRGQQQLWAEATNLPHSADQREDLCHPRVGHPQARVRAVRAPELYCFVLSFLDSTGRMEWSGVEWSATAQEETEGVEGQRAEEGRRADERDGESQDRWETQPRTQTKRHRHQHTNRHTDTRRKGRVRGDETLRQRKDRQFETR